MQQAFESHPAEELLESYSKGELSGSDAERVAKHVAGCASCKDLVERVAELRQALHSLLKQPLDYIHATPSGAVRISVTQGEDGKWRASLGGRPLDRVFDHVGDANAYALRSFMQAYPEHQDCTEACHPAPAVGASGRNGIAKLQQNPGPADDKEASD